MKADEILKRHRTSVTVCSECLIIPEDGEYYGLFVPTLCQKCYSKIKSIQIAKKSVCRICQRPYIDCCC